MRAGLDGIGWVVPSSIRGPIWELPYNEFILLCALQFCKLTFNIELRQRGIVAGFCWVIRHQFKYACTILYPRINTFAPVHTTHTYYICILECRKWNKLLYCSVATIRGIPISYDKLRIHFVSKGINLFCCKISPSNYLVTI